MKDIQNHICKLVHLKPCGRIYIIIDKGLVIVPNATTGLLFTHFIALEEQVNKSGQMSRFMLRFIDFQL